MEEPSDDTPSVTPFGRASSLREGAGNGLYHSTYRPETARLRAIFIAPTKLRGGYIPPFNVPLKNRKIAGDFHRPYETQNISPPKNFRFPPENDTGWARAPTVWEPAQSVTEKTGWARAPTYRNQLKA